MKIDQSIVAFAFDVGDTDPLSVEGGRTRWSAGGPLAEGVRLVRAPAGILEHRPEEMTVRVLAGTTVADLEATLGRHGQRSALPERGGTVGGAVAVGENHLDVPARGTLRASVLQVRYVAHDGRVVSGGAPTVKNVSGFDLPRLLAGSLGTLGLLAEVTLRTNPIPAASVWFQADAADPFAVATLLRRRSTVLWDGRRTWVHLEGHAVDLAAQRAALPGSWIEVGPPDLPAHRRSLRPAELRNLTFGHDGADAMIASVGVGTVFSTAPISTGLISTAPVGTAVAPGRADDPTVRGLATRVKALFDPTGRLNPPRDPSLR